MASKKTTTTYDNAKRYDVTLVRAVEHEGFTLKPGPNAIDMSGDLLNAIVQEFGAEAVSAATERAPAPDHPEAPPSVHETA